MRLGTTFQGPRLGTKLALMGLCLLVVPWFSYQQLVETERVLIQGQSQAQSLTAAGIATLFNGREDLFNDLPLTLPDFTPLFAQPLSSTIRLDGDATDWGGELSDRYLEFGTTSGVADGDMRILLGERADYLYGHMQIRDDRIVFRDSDYLRLDNADHIRLNFIRNDGVDGRVSLVFQEPDVVIGFSMDEQWRYAATGSADNRVQGYLKIVPETQELFLEFRFPLALLGSTRYFGISFVDVDDPVSRQIVRQTRTLPKTDKEGFNLVVLSTPEVRNIVEGLGYAGARITVIDKQQRVRAEAGDVRESAALVEAADSSLAKLATDAFRFIRPYLHRLVFGEPFNESGLGNVNRRSPSAESAVLRSLEGESVTFTKQVGNEPETIIAAHPIVAKDSVIGTVLVEQNIDDILKFQRTSLEQVLLLSIGSLLAIFIALLAFAGRLAWRIRRLRREATSAIDSYGRLRQTTLTNEVAAGDEIGDLARSVSNMLEKLQQNNSFLENMPRTLRHEINNPLNTLSTSLQNLAQVHPDVEQSKYLASAQRGVMRIGAIVQNLADAANLEEALQSDELEPVDLDILLRNYVSNSMAAHKNVEIVYQGTELPAMAMLADFRIEQLMDKIIDNAVGFHRSNTPIRVQLDRFQDVLQIAVANRGPTLPDGEQQNIFNSMVSNRSQDNRLHFGLGLYVVRVIAEYHGGQVKALNLKDLSGVVFIVQLPILADVDESNQRPIYAS